jgi:hypothetical protein
MELSKSSDNYYKRRSKVAQNFAQIAKSVSIPYLQQIDLIRIVLGSNTDLAIIEKGRGLIELYKIIIKKFG